MNIPRGSVSTPINQVQQRGVVLVISLVMLLVMTIVGVTMITGATLQERMAGNNRQLAIARLNAESALREAEEELDDLNIATSADPVATILSQFSTEDDAYAVAVYANGFTYDPLSFTVSDASEWASASAEGSVLTEAATALEGTGANAPRYVIEYIGRMAINDPSPDIDISVEKKDLVSTIPHAFRITAIGYGRDNKINAILQSIYSTADNL